MADGCRGTGRNDTSVFIACVRAALILWLLLAAALRLMATEHAVDMLDGGINRAQTEINRAQTEINRAQTERVAHLRVLQPLLEAETDIRGYRLPGDRSFVDPYRARTVDRARTATRTAARRAEAVSIALAVGCVLCVLMLALGARRRRARLHALTREIGGWTRQSLEAGVVFSGVVAALGPALCADRVYVHVAEGGDAARLGHQWCRAGLNPLPAVPSLPADVLARLDEPARAFKVPRARVRLSSSAPGGYLRGIGSDACLIAPFGVGTDVFGALVLLRSGPVSAWRSDERALVETVAADLGVAAHRALLFERQRELAARLRELDQHKNDFVSAVSHELRTPLTSVLGYVELLVQGDLGGVSPEQQRALTVIDRNVTRLHTLINDMLILSRMQGGSLAMDELPVCVDALVASAASGLAPAAAAAGLSFAAYVEPPEMYVCGDRSQLERVLADVGSNAVKFTSPGGQVTIRAQPDPDGRDVVITVADTGSGIPEDEQDALFRPFQRASGASRDAVQGAGLGLAIARMIVERHHGGIELWSRPGEGTRLTVRLPLLAEDQRTPAAATSSGHAEPAE